MSDEVTHKKGEIIGAWTLNAIVKKIRRPSNDVEWEAFCKCGRLGWIRESEFNTRKRRGCGTCTQKKWQDTFARIHRKPHNET